MSLESALALIDSVRDAKVLFVGDTILDEYHYVTPLARSQKEHLIPVRHENRETFRGGVQAAALHAASFCGEVKTATAGHAVRKVRMVDKVYLRKLFEVHYPGDDEVGGAFPDMRLYDAVVAADFGHGAISRETVERMCRDAKFLAVSAQTNSANAGFNLITKYPRADYIVIDENEARLASADRDSPIENVIRKLADGRCPKMVVTLGSSGAIGYDGTFHRMAALTNKVIDTMGAGDAFFAVTAPMARTGSMPDLLLIGNAAGAMKTQIVGHRKAIDKKSLIAYLRANATR